jgi:hypothetical protein
MYLTRIPIFEWQVVVAVLVVCMHFTDLLLNVVTNRISYRDWVSTKSMHLQLRNLLLLHDRLEYVPEFANYIASLL